MAGGKRPVIDGRFPGEEIDIGVGAAQGLFGRGLADDVGTGPEVRVDQLFGGLSRIHGLEIPEESLELLLAQSRKERRPDLVHGKGNVVGIAELVEVGPDQHGHLCAALRRNRIERMLHQILPVHDGGEAAPAEPA